MKKEQCRFSHKLNAYIDAELSKSDFEKVQVHLKHCHLCQNELRQLMKVNTFLENYQEEEVTESLIQSILNEAEKVVIPQQKSSFRRKIINFSVAASVIISFAAGVLMSDLTFQQNYETTSFELGEFTLYSYFEGGK